MDAICYVSEWGEREKSRGRYCSTWVARYEFIVAHPDSRSGAGVEGVRVQTVAALFEEDVDVVQQLFTRTGDVLAAHRNNPLCVKVWSTLQAEGALHITHKFNVVTNENGMVAM